MNYKIAKVEPLPGLCLKAFYENGDMRIYDLKPLQKRIPVFESFNNVPGLFEQMQVDVTKYAVVWNDELDLASEEIWHNGRMAETDYEAMAADEEYEAEAREWQSLTKDCNDV